MKKRTVINILIVSAVGTLLHFLYDWSGGNGFVGIFSAVNESTWEHLKLLFWPMFLLTLAEYFILDKPVGFLPSRLIGLLAGMLTIVTLYYTVTGVIGKNIDIFNILLYYLAVVTAFIVSNILIKNRVFRKGTADFWGLLIFIGIAALFIVWTFNAPELGIFIDPTEQ